MDLGEGVPLHGGVVDDKGTHVHTTAMMDRHRLRDLQIVHQSLVKARAVALAEDVGQHIEFGVTGGERGHCIPNHSSAWQVDIGLHHQLALGGLRRDGGHGEPLNGRARGNGPEVLLDEAFRNGGIDVARDEQDRIARRVVTIVEVLEIGDRSGVQVLHRADDFVTVGVADRK